jgi:hypothetical protein
VAELVQVDAVDLHLAPVNSGFLSPRSRVTQVQHVVVVHLQLGHRLRSQEGVVRLLAALSFTPRM